MNFIKFFTSLLLNSMSFKRFAPSQRFATFAAAKSQCAVNFSFLNVFLTDFSDFFKAEAVMDCFHCSF